MKVYLSIDLDFWNGKKFPEECFTKVFDLGKPLVVVMQHHYLLKHVKQHWDKCDTLVNVDWHSDIADRMDGKRKFSKQCPLNCGTWVNYIFGRNKMYIWSYPEDSCVGKWGNGYCHSILDDYNTNPFFYHNTYEICRWSKVEKRYRWFPNLEDVVAVGISISPGWTDNYLIRDFKKWIGNKEKMNV